MRSIFGNRILFDWAESRDGGIPLPRLGPVTVDRTVFAGWFVRTVGAEVELAVGVCREFSALVAEAAATVVFGAVHPDHHARGLALSLKPS